MEMGPLGSAARFKLELEGSGLDFKFEARASYVTSRLNPRDRLLRMEQPRWLDGDEVEAWLALAGLIFRLPAALDTQLQQDSNLTLFEYMVLSRLSMTPSRSARMSELASASSSSLSRLSNVVKRLEGRGLLRREPDPENGRYTVAILTEAGWELVVQAAPGHVGAVRNYVIDGLDPEQIKVLRQVACHVQGRIDASGTTPSC
jgi:DNA-binding MarR family transcriptional regulator